MPHLRNPAPPVVLGPPKHRGWTRYAHQRRADVRFVRPLDLPSQKAPGQGAGAERQRQRRGRPARTHDASGPRQRRAPRPGPSVGDSSSIVASTDASWAVRRACVEQFVVEQRMLNLDATRGRTESTDAARARNGPSGIDRGAPGHIAGRRHCRARLPAPANR